MVLNILNRFLLVLNYKLIQNITLNYLFNNEEKKRRKITIPVSYVYQPSCFICTDQ